MNWISSEYLALIGGIALCVYLYCSYQERRKGPAPAAPVLRPSTDWKAEALSDLLYDLCDDADGKETIYIFLNEEKEEVRWSCNAFQLAGETALCAIEPGGLEKLAAHRASCGNIDDLARAILRAHARKHGRGL